jgi:hypothetical protein
MGPSFVPCCDVVEALTPCTWDETGNHSLTSRSLTGLEPARYSGSVVEREEVVMKVSCCIFLRLDAFLS